MGDKVIKLSMPNQDKISGVGFLHQMSVKETYLCHTHDFYEFFYVLKGKAIHNINGEKVLLSKGSLVFIRPEDMHSYSFINNYDMELLSIGVEIELIQNACSYLGIERNYFSDTALPLQIVLNGAAYWNMAEKLLLIGKKEKGEPRRRFFIALLPSLLYQLQHIAVEKEKVLPGWLADLVEEMNKTENYTEGLRKMLALSNVSQEHLNREFKRYMGITPTEFINMKRTNYGAELLQKKYKLLDICFLCGFNNVSYFYKVFQKTYHCTPMQFVKEHIKSI